jgi:hypothetical protein
VSTFSNIPELSLADIQAIASISFSLPSPCHLLYQSFPSGPSPSFTASSPTFRHRISCYHTRTRALFLPHQLYLKLSTQHRQTPIMAGTRSQMDQAKEQLKEKDVQAIGRHCDLPSCHRLDFLPFVCESCRGYFTSSLPLLSSPFPTNPTNTRSLVPSALTIEPRPPINVQKKAYGPRNAAPKRNRRRQVPPSAIDSEVATDRLLALKTSARLRSIRQGNRQ